jgi:hypothetical protein
MPSSGIREELATHIANCMRPPLGRSLSCPLRGPKLLLPSQPDDLSSDGCQAVIPVVVIHHMILKAFGQYEKCSLRNQMSYFRPKTCPSACDHMIAIEKQYSINMTRSNHMVVRKVSYNFILIGYYHNHKIFQVKGWKTPQSISGVTSRRPLSRKSIITVARTSASADCFNLRKLSLAWCA